MAVFTFGKPAGSSSRQDDERMKLAAQDVQNIFEKRSLAASPAGAPAEAPTPPQDNSWRSAQSEEERSAYRSGYIPTYNQTQDKAQSAAAGESSLAAFRQSESEKRMNAGTKNGGLFRPFFLPNPGWSEKTPEPYTATVPEGATGMDFFRGLSEEQKDLYRTRYDEGMKAGFRQDEAMEKARQYVLSTHRARQGQDHYDQLLGEARDDINQTFGIERFNRMDRADQHALLDAWDAGAREFQTSTGEKYRGGVDALWSWYNNQGKYDWGLTADQARRREQEADAKKLLDVLSAPMGDSYGGAIAKRLTGRGDELTPAEARALDTPELAASANPRNAAEGVKRLFRAMDARGYDAEYFELYDALPLLEEQFRIKNNNLAEELWPEEDRAFIEAKRQRLQWLDEQLTAERNAKQEAAYRSMGPGEVARRNEIETKYAGDSQAWYDDVTNRLNEAQVNLDAEQQTYDQLVREGKATAADEEVLQRAKDAVTALEEECDRAEAALDTDWEKLQGDEDYRALQQLAERQGARFGNALGTAVSEARSLWSGIRRGDATLTSNFLGLGLQAGAYMSDEEAARIKEEEIAPYVKQQHPELEGEALEAEVDKQFRWLMTFTIPGQGSGDPYSDYGIKGVPVTASEVEAVRQGIGKYIEEEAGRGRQNREEAVQHVIGYLKNKYSDEQFIDQTNARTITEAVDQYLISATGEQVGRQWPSLAMSMIFAPAQAGNIFSRALKTPAAYLTFMGEFAGQVAGYRDEGITEMTAADWFCVTGSSMINAAIEYSEGGMQDFFAGRATVLQSVLGESWEELRQNGVTRIFRDVADVMSGRELKHPLYSTSLEKDAIFCVEDFWNTFVETSCTTLGMDAMHAGTSRMLQTVGVKIIRGEEVTDEERAVGLQAMSEIQAATEANEQNAAFTEAFNGEEMLRQAQETARVTVSDTVADRSGETEGQQSEETQAAGETRAAEETRTAEEAQAAEETQAETGEQSEDLRDQDSWLAELEKRQGETSQLGRMTDEELNRLLGERFEGRTGDRAYEGISTEDARGEQLQRRREAQQYRLEEQQRALDSSTQEELEAELRYREENGAASERYAGIRSDAIREQLAGYETGGERRTGLGKLTDEELRQELRDRASGNGRQDLNGYTEARLRSELNWRTAENRTAAEAEAQEALEGASEDEIRAEIDRRKRGEGASDSFINVSDNQLQMELAVRDSQERGEAIYNARRERYGGTEVQDIVDRAESGGRKDAVLNDNNPYKGTAATGPYSAEILRMWANQDEKRRQEMVRNGELAFSEALPVTETRIFKRRMSERTQRIHEQMMKNGEIKRYSPAAERNDAWLEAMNRAEKEELESLELLDRMKKRVDTNPTADEVRAAFERDERAAEDERGEADRESAVLAAMATQAAEDALEERQTEAPAQAAEEETAQAEETPAQETPAQAAEEAAQAETPAQAETTAQERQARPDDVLPDWHPYKGSDIALQYTEEQLRRMAAKDEDLRQMMVRSNQLRPDQALPIEQTSIWNDRQLMGIEEIFNRRLAAGLVNEDDYNSRIENRNAAQQQFLEQELGAIEASKRRSEAPEGPAVVETLTPEELAERRQAVRDAIERNEEKEERQDAPADETAVDDEGGAREVATDENDQVRPAERDEQADAETGTEEERTNEEKRETAPETDREEAEGLRTDPDAPFKPMDEDRALRTDQMESPEDLTTADDVRDERKETAEDRGDETAVDDEGGAMELPREENNGIRTEEREEQTNEPAQTDTRETTDRVENGPAAEREEAGGLRTDPDAPFKPLDEDRTLRTDQMESPEDLEESGDVRTEQAEQPESREDDTVIEEEAEAREVPQDENDRIRTEEREELKDAEAGTEEEQRNDEQRETAPETDRETGEVNRGRDLPPRMREEEETMPGLIETDNADNEETEEEERRTREDLEKTKKAAEELGVTFGEAKDGDRGVHLVRGGGSIDQTKGLQLKLINAYSKLGGFAVNVYDKLENGMANGQYRPEDGRVIRIALDAENPLTTVMGHELYHMLKKTNTASADRIAKLFDKMAKANGLDVQREVAAIIARYNRAGIELGKTAEDAAMAAKEELIANSLYDVIRDGSTMRTLLNSDRGLYRQIMNWVQTVSQRIGRMLNTYKAGSPEARMLERTRNAMDDMADELLRGLHESDKLDKVKKSAGANYYDADMKRHRQQLMEAQTEGEAHQAVRELARDVLKKTGNEVTDENVEKLIWAGNLFSVNRVNAAQELKDAGLKSENANDPDVKRAMDAIGRYLDNVGHTLGTDAMQRFLDGKVQEEREAFDRAVEDGTRYSIIDFLNRSNQVASYVKASQERNILEGVQPSEWRSTVERYINKNIRHGKDLVITTDNGTKLTLTENSAGKLTSRDKNSNGVPISDDAYALKLRIAAHIDEVARISKGDKGTVPDRKNHRFARDGFFYRDSYFMDYDKQFYKLKISIGKDGKINSIYNINRIEGAATPHGAQGPKALTRRGAGPSDIRILQGVPEVKPQYSLKETSIVDKIYSELQSIQEKKTEFWNDPEYNKAKERLNFANGITEKVEARRALRALEKERGYTALVERESELRQQLREEQQRQEEERKNRTPRGRAVHQDYAEVRKQLAAMNAEYMEAARKGDTRKAARMYREAAEIAFRNSMVRDQKGKLLTTYHYSNNEFTSFDRSKARSGIEMDAFFFAPDPESSREFGKNQLRAYLNITSPYYNPTFNYAKDDQAGRHERERLQALGYDGAVRTDDDGNITEYIAFDENQIKSTVPITYDDNGNVIPLTERFSESKDIRYSLKDTGDEFGDMLDEIIARDVDTGSSSEAAAVVNRMKEMMAGRRESRYGEWKAAIGSMADTLLSETASKRYSKAQVERRLTELFEELDNAEKAGDINGEEYLRRALDGIRWITGEMMSDTASDELLNEVREAIRGGLYVSPDQMAELGGVAEQRDFRRAMSGITRIITKDDKGVKRLSDVWRESLSRIDPGTFREDAAEIDMARDLLDWVETRRDAGEYIDSQTREYIQGVAIEAMAEYFAGPQTADEQTERTRSALKKANAKVQTLSGQLEKQVKEKMALNREMDELKKARDAAVDAQDSAEQNLEQERRGRQAAAGEIAELKQRIREQAQAQAQTMQELKEAHAEAEKLEGQLRVRDNREAAMQANLKAMKQRMSEQRREVLARDRESRQKRARDKKNRDDIKKIEQKMRRMLEKPSNSAFVPMDRVRQLLNFVEAIQGADVREVAKGTESWMRAVREMREDKGNYYISNAFDEDSVSQMQAAADILSEKTINKLDSDELEYVAKTVRQTLHQLENAQKLVTRTKNADALVEAQNAIGVLNGQKKRAVTGAGKVADDITRQHLTPRSEFNKMAGYDHNNAIWRSYESLNEAERNYNRIRRDASAIFEDLMKDKRFVKFAGKKAELIDTGIKRADGKSTFKITHAQLVSLLMHSKNQQNVDGMANGFTVPNAELLRKGKVAEAWAQGERMYVDVQQLKRIVAMASDYDRAWAEAWAKYQEYITPLLNDASMLRYGWHKFTVPNYFPIRRDGNYLATDFESVMLDDRVSNMGFSKARKNAKNPMMLIDMVSVVNQAINGNALYAAMLNPINDFNKVFNATMPDFEDSVKAAIKRVYGEGEIEYIERLMKNLQQASLRGDRSMMDSLRGKAATATLGANLGVVIKQAASYPAAAAVLGWQPLMKALAGNRKFDQKSVEKYTAVMWERNAQTIQAMNANTQNNSIERTSNFLMQAITGVDKRTISKIGAACEIAVEMEHPDWARGSEEYNRAVAEKLMDCVEQTQPEYSTMHRPHALRSESQLTKMVTMYKTQPMQNFNVLYDAAMDYRAQSQKYKENKTEENLRELNRAKAGLARAVSSQVVSALVLAVMTALGKLLLHKPEPYQDEAGEITPQSVGGRLASDAMSSMAGMMIGGGELYDLIKGIIEGKQPYDIEANSLSMVNDVYQSLYRLGSAATAIGDANLTGEQKLQKAGKAGKTFLESIGAIFGLPIKNLENLGTSAWAYGTDLIGGNVWEGLQGTVSASTGAEKLGRALLRGDKGTYTRVYNRMRAQGKTDQQINTVLKSWLKANDPRVTEAAMAIESGDLTTYNRLINGMTADGIPMSMAVSMVETKRKALEAEDKAEAEEAPFTAMSYEEIMEGKAEEDASPYTASQMNALLEAGNTQGALEVQKALFRSKGTTSVKSSLTSYWKPKYREAYEAKNRAEVSRIERLMKAMGLTDATIKKWVETDSSTASTSAKNRTGFGSSSFGGSFGSSTKKKKKKGGTPSFGSSGFGSSSFGGSSFGG